MATSRAVFTVLVATGLLSGPAAGQQSSDPAERKAAYERILFGGIRSNNTERISEALEGGADPNHAKDPFSDTPPLFVAVGQISVKREIVELLIRRGADVNARWTPGNTKRKSDADNNPLLLRLGQQLAAESNRDYFPLYWAAMNNNPRAVKVLVQSGADVHAKTGKLGMTALFATRDPAVGEVLLENGADLNAKDAHGQTVLAHARKQLKLVEKSAPGSVMHSSSDVYVRWLEAKGAQE